MSETISLTRLVEQLRDQQCRDWENGDRKPVETYLKQHLAVQADADSALTLVYQEILLRERHGEKPNLGEYVPRFPHLAERLERLFSVHTALESDELLAFRDSAGEVTLPGHTPSEEVQWPDIPGFEILEEVGRGGAGVVYKARQKSLDRVVALKLLLAGVHASPEELKRFRREAETQAKLQHPNIVPIHEVGEITVAGSGLSVHYLAMEFLEGGSLARQLGGKPLPARAAARLVETLARAVHFAHHHGLVHRDLKPGNILLSSGEGPKAAALHDAVPKIADFGLVKRLQADGAASTSGSLVGTPSYMAPEQAAGKAHAIGPATDIYALGAILYETLTGRPPFVGESTISTLMQVQYQDPVPVRKLHPRAPRDLETICLKCLRKDPAKRYAAAAALADDLRRFQEGRPILARPTPLAERLLRWCARNPLPAAAAVVVVLTAVTAFALIASAWRQEQEAARLAREKGEEAAQKRKEAELQNAYLTFHRALALCEQGQTYRGILWLVRGLEQAVAVENADLERVVRTHLDGWSRQMHVLSGCTAHGAGVLEAAFSPDGQRIAVAGKDRRILVYDAALKQVLQTLEGHDSNSLSVAFSPDGRKLAAGLTDGTARLWDLATGQLLGPPLKHDGQVNRVAFSPDSTLLLTGGSDSFARIWNVEERKLLQELHHGGNVVAAAFHPDGTRVATGSRNYTAYLWDVQTGKQVEASLPHPQTVNSLAFHPDGHTLMTGCHDGVVRFWDIRAGGKLSRRLSHRRIVQSVAYSRNGEQVVTGHIDGTARIWHAETGAPVGDALLHDGWVTTAAFNPEGTRVVTGSRDGPLRLWEIARAGKDELTLTHDGSVNVAVFSPDGKRVATAGQPPKLGGKIWNVTEGTQGARLAVARPRRLQALAFSPDGKWVVGGGPGDAVQDGKRPKVGLVSGLVTWWDADQKRHGPLLTEGIIRAVAFSPDSKTFAAGGQGKTVQVWRAEDGQPVGKPLPHEEGIFSLTFRPSGQLLLTGGGRGARGEVRFWDYLTGEEKREPLRQSSIVISMGFTPDGKTFFTGCENGTVRLWDAETMQPRGNPIQTPSTINCAALSPEGDMVLTDSQFHFARLWDVATGLPLGPPLWHRNWIHAVSFNPKGKTMLTAGQDGTARIWHVPIARPGPAEEMRRQVETATGLRLDEDDSVRVLDAAAWQVLQRP